MKHIIIRALQLLDDIMISCCLSCATKWLKSSRRTRAECQKLKLLLCCAQIKTLGRYMKGLGGGLNCVCSTCHPLLQTETMKTTELVLYLKRACVVALSEHEFVVYYGL